ncbi:hypothetical protein, conserved [Trypanosoma brucei gambiense DAL972]|uniref:Uncharacterized protein n=1 Tax=Trypanosoma brucei gambiense (strain MHOM/CI/86/DAL972) TaxID=679716 RepID=C9ZSG0_TRYB9|nr:hypothetical protein, conserved [Trypanosoma brucei gambiense DAL972]CBH12344.1 hypothetical protein, conserved [Trypanosoma brucei gambiense DAL972]|eukprot:XP_011774625.1 hypothetical protein, conserved [Trypanosoma brucei gambiense DAL972]
MSTTALSSAKNARSPGSNAAVSPGSRLASLREGASTGVAKDEAESDALGGLAGGDAEGLAAGAMSGLAETATEAAADELGDAAAEDQANFFSGKLVEVIPQCNEIEGERDLNGELLGEEAPRTDEGDVNNVGCSSAAESLPQEEQEETEEQIIIRLQKELREFEAYEKEMQPNLNMYEDIIELRREAEQLEDDRKRALLQIDLGDISSYYDGDVEREVEELEAAVENSYLQACWTKERQRYIARNETDLPEWWRVNVKDLSSRLKDARASFDSSNRVAQDLYRAHEVKVNATTDSRDKAKAEIFNGMKAEIEATKGERERLRQLQKDQLFHLRRGTHVKDQLLTTTKERDIREARVADMESKLVQQRYALNNEMKELNGDIEGLKRLLTDQKHASRETLETLKKQHVAVDSSRGELSEAREKYERENSELMLLKHDLQTVLHYIRVRAREADK